jgi:toxin YoeB
MPDRTPFAGIGKPEPLKGDLTGWWSRRITGEVPQIEIVACRYHYG